MPASDNHFGTHQDRIRFHYKEFFKSGRVPKLMFLYNVGDGYDHTDFEEVETTVRCDISWTGFCALNWHWIKD
jgi:hypothetical protein